ncbi:hypothetical protein D3C71_1663810 [compost metagenome]
MAGMNRQLVTLLNHLHHLLQLAEIQPRRNALGIQVERQRHQIDIAGAFTVAEQTTFYPVGTGQHCQLGAGHSGATIVMRMHADGHPVALTEAAAEPLNLVGVDVRRTDFHRRRQVDDHRPPRSRLPDIGNGFTDLQRKLQLGKAESLR